jgi:rhamnosyltransferase
MSVLVLMAVYNGEKWLNDQILSIFAQKDVSIHIVASDDLSTDASLEILRSFGSKSIDILPTAERFGTACRNFFRLLRDVDLTSFDYVSFSDQDDIWLPEKISRALSLLQRLNVDAVSSDVEAFWPNGRRKFIKKSQRLCAWDHLFQSAGPGCTYVMTKRLALDIQNVLRQNRSKTDTIALHDWFVYCYARSNSYKWHIDNVPNVMYRQHDTNEFGVNAGWAAIRSRWRRIKQGWYRDQVVQMAALCGQSDAPPIKRMQRYSWYDRVALMCYVCRLRRGWRDRIALAITFIVPNYTDSRAWVARR